VKAMLHQLKKKKGKKKTCTDDEETPNFDELPLLKPIDIDDMGDKLDSADLEDLTGMVDDGGDESDREKL
jgi:hypothetical protein